MRNSREKNFSSSSANSEALVVGMAIDIGIELRGEEIAVDHVAFELGHVDAVGGKAAHRLVERRRHVAHAEDEGGDQRARALRRPFLLARQHHEARGVVRLVLDVLGQDVEAVDLGGEARGDGGARSCRRARRSSRAEPAVSAATIGLMPSLRMMLRHWPSAWTWLSTVLMSASVRALHAPSTGGGPAGTTRRRCRARRSGSR